MNVKTYRASGMRDALAKVKADLGPDAVILSTQRIDDAGLGHGGSYVEITATTEGSPSQPSGMHLFQRLSRGTAYQRAQAPQIEQANPGELHRNLDGDRLRMLIEPLLSEVRDLRSLVEDSGILQEASPSAASELADRLMRAQSQTQSLTGLDRRTRGGLERSVDQSLATLRQAVLHASAPGQADSLASDPQQMMASWLLDADVAPHLTRDIVAAVRGRLGKRNRPTRDEIEGALIEELIGRVRIRPSSELHRRNVVAYIGPTGVGKTTSLAKHAAFLSMDKRLDVGLITIDTYRIGAIEQLRKYASLLDVPLEVVVDRLTLEQALRRLERCDTVLIDTVGRSPRAGEGVGHLRQLFGGLPGLSFELCISGTTALRDMRGIVETYRPLAADNLLFTKLDESFACGPLLSTHLEEQIPLSWFTTGQRVPDDMERASVERILSMIIPMA